MTTTTMYRVDDANGNELTVGLSEHEARDVAQSLANRLDRTVYLSLDVPADDEDDQGDEPEAIEPEGA